MHIVFKRYLKYTVSDQIGLTEVYTGVVKGFQSAGCCAFVIKSAMWTSITLPFCFTRHSPVFNIQYIYILDILNLLLLPLRCRTLCSGSRGLQEPDFMLSK